MTSTLYHTKALLAHLFYIENDSSINSSNRRLLISRFVPTQRTKRHFFSLVSSLILLIPKPEYADASSSVSVVLCHRGTLLIFARDEFSELSCTVRASEYSEGSDRSIHFLALTILCGRVEYGTAVHTLIPTMDLVIHRLRYSPLHDPCIYLVGNSQDIRFGSATR